MKNDQAKLKGNFMTYREELISDGRINCESRIKPQNFNKTVYPDRSKQLNVLWIMTDQQRADTFGCKGFPKIQTPNMDKLIQEGMSFERSYCSSPVCLPSRASFLSGKYVGETGAWQNNCLLNDDVELLPTILKNAGYRGANIGKDHFGRNPKLEWEFDQCIEDSFGATAPRSVPFMPALFEDNLFMGHQESTNSDLMVYGKYPGPLEMSKSYLLANAAVNWLGWNDDPRPFLLRVSFDDPHPPVVPPEPYFGMYNPDDMPDELFSDAEKSMANKPKYIQEFNKFSGADELTEKEHRRHAAEYCALITHMDAQIGRVLDKLDELGLRENTIVILNSDHGHMIGEHGFAMKGVTMHEGVAKIPTVIRWPGKIEENSKSDALVSNVDFLPTILDVLNISDKDKNLVGKSMKPLFYGENESIRDCVFLHWDDFGWGIVEKEWKLTFYDGNEQGELYYLPEDPYEKNNRWGDETVNDIKNDLLKKVNQWKKQQI